VRSPGYAAVRAERTTRRVRCEVTRERVGIERLPEAGPPKVNPEKDPQEWLKAEGALRPKLQNEKPKGETVPYEQLLQAWKEGRVK